MSSRYNNPPEFHGIWSHGVAHGYYGYSHDFRLVFLPDGRGSFCHDGWWRYRVVTFYWHVTPSNAIQFIAQRGIADVACWGYRGKRLVLPLAPISLDCNMPFRKLTIPLADEPNDYFLVSTDLETAERLLTPDERGSCGFPVVNWCCL